MTSQTEACQALEQAVHAIAEYALDEDEVVTDAIIILGAQ